ncbi:Pimeloyl-ACP methyl ester carboxylesterase [Actinomadura meyerae]|jgi:pimeloyl-ACP methyl ester carboxylesterase|uniref:Pimeloyl-ACP methyl ester carboxylesterase n=1 Tax=Actinomadura meyerae TaxID=240840 RepID=A0A239MU20_9ACTN|nr:alpha/beta hydrolase [Actinomadura meyerae]SNT46236.1 Pimeloyl-ACP methyl ester carboxylesterase [Actinomadura meyerae]
MGRVTAGRAFGGLLAATAAGAAGAGAGLVAQRRAMRRLQLRPDPFAGEPFGSLRGRPVPVRADDGTRLYAEIDGDDRTDLAVVFSHGWTLTQDSWHFQRKALRGLGRLVFWDQRGHGRSDGGDREGYSVTRLAADLAAVIAATVPAGTPVVLVGHSMGGMTIMRYADEHPELIGRRILATGLLCTSSGGLSEITLGMPALLARTTHRVLPRALGAVGAGSGAVERVRHLGRDAATLVEDLVAFGPDASPAAVAFAEQMMTETRMDAFAAFLRSMITTDVISDCAALGRADTLVIGGENDMLTPVEHSLKIASCVPSARLEVVPTAGHMAMMERPGTVSDHLGDLIERARKLC